MNLQISGMYILLIFMVTRGPGSLHFTNFSMHMNPPPRKVKVFVEGIYQQNSSAIYKGDNYQSLISADSIDELVVSKVLAK